MIFFDLDGTLFDAGRAQARSWEDAFRAVLGRTVSLDSVDHHGATALKLLQLLAEPDEPDRVTVAALFAAHARALDRELAGGLALLPGVAETLDVLVSRGVPLGVATGNSPRATSVLLAASGVTDRFTALVCGHRTASRPEMLAPTWDHTEAGRTPVIVGDTPHDLRAAAANACLPVGVATGIYSLDDLRTHGAHLVLPDLRPPAAEELGAAYGAWPRTGRRVPGA